MKSRDELEGWLSDKPDEWAQVIAMRAALRAFPYANHALAEWTAQFAVALIRALLFSWTARNTPAIHIEASFFDSTARAADLASRKAVRFKFSTAMSADAAYLATLSAKSRSLRNAAQAVVSTVEAADRNDVDIWKSVRADCDWLLMHGDQDSAVRVLTRRSLWLGQPTIFWRMQSNAMISKLLDIDDNYAVWTDWYERRIRGERAAFDIPGDKGRKEDKVILHRLAEATDENFWGKGHEYVNATLKGWLDEARARVAPPPSSPKSPDSVAETLLQQSSPQAQITHGKLDAVPNTTFDKPQYSDNLAEFPSELLAFTSTILNSLPTNCAAIVRNCFTGFRDEMLVRGNQPILNILKAMAASLTAELYGNPAADTSPDEWKLKDPREWEAGMASMFGSFFKGYHDLIHHFPLDTEREEFIAATPIDEMAASGAALTGPVDQVAALIVELGKQGFATDNIVRIVEAHQLYNRDVAQLPTPSQPSDAITPKRRHVLQTAGFYLHTYSILASTKELWPIFVVLAERLQVSINAMLAFIR